MAGTLRAKSVIKPKRKKWVQIFALILFGLGIIGFIFFSLSLTLIMWGAAFLLFMWDHHSDKNEKQIRKKAYISRFSPMELRTAIYNTNLVYKVLREDDQHLTVQIVWSGEAEVRDGIEQTIDINSVRPFDLDLFINLT